MTRKVLLAGIGIIWLSYSCRNSNFEEMRNNHVEEISSQRPPKTDTSTSISFRNDVLPIMQVHCGTGNNSCHSAQAVGSGASPYGLFDYEGVKRAQSDGLLYSSIIWDGNASRMPKRSQNKIDALYIDTIKKWIDQGMPNN